MGQGIFVFEAAFPEFIAVFNKPTIARGALWLPFRRNNDELLTNLESAVNSGTISTVFCHLDVQGAYMSNQDTPSAFGLDPSTLTLSNVAKNSKIQLYSGHYHYPGFHPINKQICYIGSTYQVSASEAGQKKRLIHLAVDETDKSWYII